MSGSNPNLPVLKCSRVNTRFADGCGVMCGMCVAKPATGRPCVPMFLVDGVYGVFFCVLSALLRGDARVTCVCLGVRHVLLHEVVYKSVTGSF